MLMADWIETPIGRMVAVADRRVLHLLEFDARQSWPRQIMRIWARTGAGFGLGRTGPIEQVADELTAYFAGRSARFRTPLAFDGTEFTRAVWNALRQIPPGATLTYTELAAAAGRPQAARAAGRANGSNQIAIVVPCHRVVGGSGALTGYAGGLWRKQWLIDHERRIAATADRLPALK